MENRIIAYIGIWGSMILANTFTNRTLGRIMIAQAVILLLRYGYLKYKQ